MGGYRPDAFDLTILEILQSKNTTSHREIGERVHLSSSAVHRRVRRLEEERVILANTAIVDPAAVGRPITIIVEVHIERERLDLLDEMRVKFHDHPDVQQCYYVTGEADFVLIVNVASMDHYEALTRELFLGNPNVKRFRTLVVMGKVKTGLMTPVRAPG